MKRIWLIIFALFLSITVCLFSNAGAEDKEEKLDELTTRQLQEESKDLDNQILDLNKKIQDVISRYELLSPESRIKVLPYQISLKRGSNFIKVEKHRFIKSSSDYNRIVGLDKKSLRITTSGKTVSMMETVISQLNYDDESLTVVNILDPSPNSAEKKTIQFEFMRNDKVLKKVKLKGIQNTTAFPIRNEIKRNFIIPHLTYFYSVILDIAEGYKMGMKNADALMTDFLKKSTYY